MNVSLEYYWNSNKYTEVSLDALCLEIEENKPTNTKLCIRDPYAFQRLTPAHWRILAQSLAQNTVITWLSVDRWIIEDEELVFPLACLKSLKHLEFNWCRLKTQNIIELCGWLSANSVIEEVSVFERQYIGETGWLAVMETIRANNTIKKFDFRADNLISSETVHMLLNTLKFNTVITCFSFPKCKHGGVKTDWIEDCFRQNTTLQHGASSDARIAWFVRLNREYREFREVCEFSDPSIGDLFRTSVPRTVPEAQIGAFLRRLREQSEGWRSMRLVVLGNEGIGKTTLVHQMRKVVIDHSVTAWFKKKMNVKSNKKALGSIKSTIGIDCNTISFGGGEIAVWDFAGRMENSATHNVVHTLEMVIYLVCFDLGASLDEQAEQIQHWMEFLNSALSSSTVPHRTSLTASNSGIILVGLRSDLASKSEISSKEQIQTWKEKWPYLPIFHQMPSVSATTSLKSVHTLWKSVSRECKRIIFNRPRTNPPIYRTILESIQSHPESNGVVKKDDLFQRHSCSADAASFNHCLRYLHSIGRIILLNNDMVLINTALGSKIAAKFL